MKARIQDRETGFESICEAVQLRGKWYWYNHETKRFLFLVGETSPFFSVVFIIDERRKE